MQPSEEPRPCDGIGGTETEDPLETQVVHVGAVCDDPDACTGEHEHHLVDVRALESTKATDGLLPVIALRTRSRFRSRKMSNPAARSSNSIFERSIRFRLYTPASGRSTRCAIS